MTKSAVDAEEIVQDCFTKLWLKKESAASIDNINSYLYRMVRNRGIDYMRKTAADQRLIAQVWANLSQTDTSLEDELHKKETQQLIGQAVAQLSPQKQQVYRLSREKEMSHEEIAKLMGLSKSRIANILVEVLKHIKLHLAQQSPGLALLFWIYAWEQLI